MTGFEIKIDENRQLLIGLKKDHPEGPSVGIQFVTKTDHKPKKHSPWWEDGKMYTDVVLSQEAARALLIGLKVLDASEFDEDTLKAKQAEEAKP
jgi:hypothetical protein